MLSFGVDRLVDDNFAPLKGERVGLFTNLSAVNRDLTTTYDLFHTAKGVNLTALFSPEHGFAGAVADGVSVQSSIDTQTGLPVYSLYGDTQRPTPDMLRDVDILVCDIQDIGIRYYTFLWTITHILEACGVYNVRVMLLDRPNPLGGLTVRGGGLHAELASLVGRYAIPIQHGMTLAEVATLINNTWNPHPAQITVVPCEGWMRDITWPQTGRAFVPPSPNMPHFSTVMQYAGACLVEGTTLSEGRGTALPFEIVGAPGVDGAPSVDGAHIAQVLNALNLEGVRFRPHQFQPNASKHAGKLCGGVQVHITDPRTFDALNTWLHVLVVMRPYFDWLPAHFDRLIGDSETRHLIDAGEAVSVITARWHTFEDAFKTQREAHLRY